MAPLLIPHLYNGKDKTFFMASYGGFRLVQSATSLSTSMPAAFFNGNFSSVPAGSITGGVLKDPLNGNAPFPGNIIPAARISPVALKLQQYYPATDLPGLASNYSVPVPTTINTDQTVDRIDQNIGDKIRLYARADYQNESVFGGNAIPTNANTTPVTDSNYTVGYTHTITPDLPGPTISRVGRNFFFTAILNPFSVSGNKNAGTALGIPGFNGDSTFNNPGIPDFNITGFNGLNNASTNWYQNDSTTQLYEQMSWNHHSLQYPGRTRIPSPRHRTRRRQQRSRSIHVQRNPQRLRARRFHPRNNVLLYHARTRSARPHRQIARRLLRHRQMAGHPKIHARLRHPLQQALPHRRLHHQRRRH